MIFTYVEMNLSPLKYMYWRRGFALARYLTCGFNLKGSTLYFCTNRVVVMWSALKNKHKSKWILVVAIFYAPEIEDRGAYCFCPVCHSVILTLTLLITFEQQVLELWYFTWVFLVIRRWYHNFLTCDLDLRVWPIFKKFNLANNFWIVSARALIFYMNIPCDEIFL